MFPPKKEATIAVYGDEATGGFNEESPVPFLTENNRVRSRRVTNFCLGIRIRIRIEIVSGPAASCSVLFLTVVYNRCILKKE